MNIKHFINLSNGFNCPHYKDILVTHGVTRIQSTACEQKKWAQILHEAGAELFFSLAQGNACIIHDKSEKDRETRACWQGLAWIRYALYRAWSGYPPIETSRGGMDLRPYFDQVYRELPEPTKRLIKFYRKYYRGGPIRLYSCYRTHVSLAVCKVKKGRK